MCTWKRKTVETQGRKRKKGQTRKREDVQQDKKQRSEERNKVWEKTKKERGQEEGRIGIGTDKGFGRYWSSVRRLIIQKENKWRVSQDYKTNNCQAVFLHQTKRLNTSFILHTGYWTPFNIGEKSQNTDNKSARILSAWCRKNMEKKSANQ